jgi:hypothetical protein
MVPQSAPCRCPTMAGEHRKPKNLGVLVIHFSPVVREGLQSILTKDERSLVDTAKV